ncbi:unnamed protein product [Rotaria sp. Silwood2]|nr:unnamed protein product [Rotaria sp. Silwood2]CAF2611248.1 unnamed protein product [Rotaria sp. Silwood2]CAF4030889.1 unnamed protein product [Rotaria sp. Silwood2]CAF4044432.1 unnamed protein product [Rotaria sp. Silwood2]
MEMDFFRETHAAQTLPISSSHSPVHTFTRRLHTSPVYFDLIDVRAPSFPESVTESCVRLLKKIGDKVSADEIIAEIETHKIALNITVPQAGTITAFLVADGDKITSNARIALLNTSDDVKPVSENKEDASTKIIDTEKVKHIPEESTDDKINPEQTKETSYTCSVSPKPSYTLAPAAGSERDTSARPKLTIINKQEVSDIHTYKSSDTRTERREKMSRMRLKIAERLKQAQNTCAMLTTFNEIDMSNIIDFRKKYADQFLKRHNIKLGFMSAFIKASACALLDSPIVNAAIDGNEIVYHDYVDISVAVASPKGLVVPVLRNVENMNYADIERAINEFGEKAKNNSLTIEDMNGGTFTISNGGVFGSLFGTPIINPPQSAILGMHGIFDRPVVINGKLELRPMMYVALTYDHRILDGRDAVLFLRKIKQYVEDSRTIFLDI